MNKRIFAIAWLYLSCVSCVEFESEPLDPSIEYERLSQRGQTGANPPPQSFLPSDLFPLVAHVDASDGLSLAEVNALALFYTPSLVAARRDLRLQGAELLRAGLLSNPELFLGPRIATQGGGLIFPASMSLEIPLGGRHGAEKNRASADLEAARCQLLDREAQVLFDVRRRFVGLAAFDRRRRILEDVRAASDAAFEKAERLLRAGESDRVALGLVELDRDEVAQQLREANRQSAEARVELTSAIGLLPEVSTQIRVDASLLDAHRLPPPEHQSVLNHAGLKALEAKYRSAEFGLEIEIARQYPALRLGPELESDEGQTSLGIGLTLPIPLFDTNAGGIAVAQEERAASREAWRAALLDLAGREYLARLRHAEAIATLEALQLHTIPAASAVERALEARQLSGQFSLIEMLAARSAIARARLREVDGMADAAVQALEVLWLSGGLFPATTTPGGEE